MTNFDADTLSALREGREVRIRTGKHPESAVVIWVVVAGDAALVQGSRDRRSRRSGSRQPTARRAGGSGERSRFDRRASRAFLAKYQSSPYAQAMVKADLLPTTLRLEPRG
jgi:hypothetical protein